MVFIIYIYLKRDDINRFFKNTSFKLVFKLINCTSTVQHKKELTETKKKVYVQQYYNHDI